MQIIQPSFDIIFCDPHALRFLEKVARTCYKSEDKITTTSADPFIEGIVKRGHEAMIEHSSISVKFIHNRGFSHELVRHRVASYAQESTRYCSYDKGKFGGELTLIEPYWFKTVAFDEEEAIKQWFELMKNIELHYLNYITHFELPAQAARGILPNDLKTEIVMTANIREWRNVLKLRTSPAAHPDMRRVMIPLLDRFVDMYPVLFQDIRNELNSHNE